MKPRENVNGTVGANIKRLRTGLGMTRTALAAKAGMDDSHIGKMERGLRGTTSGNYALLAAALGVPLDALFRPALPTPHVRRVSKPAA